MNTHSRAVRSPCIAFLCAKLAQGEKLALFRPSQNPVSYEQRKTSAPIGAGTKLSQEEQKMSSKQGRKAETLPNRNHANIGKAKSPGIPKLWRTPRL
jgi:hypothetical protein